MRQWLVCPLIMCRKHLLGEHCEHHMFVGSLKRKNKMDGYIKNNCLEPLSLQKRHNEISIEMKRRKYNHKSPLTVPSTLLEYLGKFIYTKINKEESLLDLLLRCPTCLKRYKYILNNYEHLPSNFVIIQDNPVLLQYIHNEPDSKLSQV